MDSEYAWKVEKGSKVKLKDYDPNYKHTELAHEEAALQLQNLGDEISKLQELLSAAQHHSMLIILQGMDTSSNDGTIRHVFSRVNPQGCYVHPFKEPTEDEMSHDVLLRVHKIAP